MLIAKFVTVNTRVGLVVFNNPIIHLTKINIFTTAVIIPYGNAMKSDCSMGADSTEWKAIMPDGTLVEPGTAGTLHYDYISSKLTINTSRTADAGSHSIAFGSLAAQSGIAIPQIAIAAGLIKDSADTYGTSGHQQYVNTDGERLPLRGSSFSDASNGGAAALHLLYARSGSYFNVSFRSAFVE